MKNSRILKLAVILVASFSSHLEAKSLMYSSGPLKNGAALEVSAEPLVKAYLSLKDALVASQAEEASQAARTIYKLVEERKGEGLPGMLFSAEKIIDTGDLQEQRKHFASLSEQFYAWLKKEEALDQTLYKQKCPMALEKGAFWFSASKEVRNPFFGDKMLRCGSVEETIEK